VRAWKLDADAGMEVDEAASSEKKKKDRKEKRKEKARFKPY
jgi:hypothetical protein